MERAITGRCSAAVACKVKKQQTFGFSKIIRSNNLFPDKRSATWFWVVLMLVLGGLPWQSAFATSGIKNAVISFCAPNPTNPNISVGCSGCHSSNNPSNGDLIQPQANWSMSPATYSNFCPQANTPPPVTPTPTPTPTPPGVGGAPPGTPGGGSGSPGGMGAGAGGSLIDMDDDDDDHDDDDDKDMDDDDDGGATASLGSFRARVLSSRSSRGSGRSRRDR